MQPPYLQHKVRAAMPEGMQASPRHFRTSFCYANSSALYCLIYGFCSSARNFASGFLQIPPRDGHPCLWLTLPAAIYVEDFHLQVIAHAGHTKRKMRSIFTGTKKCGGDKTHKGTKC